MKVRILTSVFIFVVGLFFSQIRISGKITYKNKAIKDVNITLKNTYDGATSSVNGQFSFETTEKGTQTLVFTHPKYIEAEKSIQIENENLSVNFELKEQFSEIDAVVISAGNLETSDKSRTPTALSTIDFYTTPGSNGQVTPVLATLPGVQSVGESEGLFVRGGTAGETKFFIDGSLVNNYFTNSVPGIAGRDRFSPALFKGNIFSRGGYSAQFGQALSSILSLESIDFPEKTEANLGVSPLFISAGFQKVNPEKSASFGTNLDYSNLGLMTKILKFNTQFTKAPSSFGTDFNFRFRTKNNGIIKYYGSFDTNTLELKNPSLESNLDDENTNLNAKNTFHNLSYKQKFGKYSINFGSSFAYNQNLIELNYLKNNQNVYTNIINVEGQYYNAKVMIDRKLNKISSARLGFELNQSNEKTDVSLAQNTFHFKDHISSIFAETDLALNNDFSIKIGARTEYSSQIAKWNFAPRLALAYRMSKTWTTNVAYGKYFQNPESKYFSGVPLNYQQSTHYIFQLQRNSEGRNLRLEAFFKKYDDLLKTSIQNNRQIGINNEGFGYAKGIELFWRDKKTIKNIDYWISYSYLDSKRDFLNFPISLFPNFASEHNASIIIKKFVMKWKTGFNISFKYSKARPFYDIISDNGQNIIRNQGRLTDLNDVNFSMNYLPNIGKMNAKFFPIFVLSVNNILGTKQIFGYNFSQDGMRSSTIRPPIGTFVFVGAFISFGVDRSQETIDKNL